MDPILAPDILDGLAEIAVSAMQTEVSILRRSVTDHGTTIVADDLGDDDVTFTETSESKRTRVMGSFSSTPTPVQVVDADQLVTVNTYKLALPRGTDIKPGDTVLVAGVEYTVSDTTDESTWQALLLVSLRKVD